MKLSAIKKVLPPVLVSLAIGVAFALPAGAMLGTVGPSYGYIGRLGGTLLGGPGAGSNATRMDEYVIGTDKGVWYRTFSSGAWGGWATAGGVATSDPGAATFGTKSDVFVRASDNEVAHRSSVAGVWAAWELIGGTATSATDADSWGAGRLDIVVKGTDN